MRRRFCAWRGYRKTQQAGRQGDQEGQSLVEMAITFPLLLLLLIAVIDFARIFDASIVLTNAVREGARYASLDGSLTASHIQQMVMNDVTGSGTNITLMADFSASNVTIIQGTNDVQVTAAYDFGLWFGGIIGLNTVHLERTAVMPRF
jgi:Flp pilus assembly protein TadG